MKVKLLRKVRKNYSIIKVEELASDASDLYKHAADRVGLPFYIVKKNDDFYSFQTKFFKDYDDAHDDLWEKILKKYKEKFRHSDGKSTTVWWSKNK